MNPTRGDPTNWPTPIGEKDSVLRRGHQVRPPDKRQGLRSSAASASGVRGRSPHHMWAAEHCGTSACDHEASFREAGIREVRDRFNHYLDQVRRGREVIITERGREAAALIPLRNRNTMEDAVARLQTEGLVEMAHSWRPLTSSKA